MNDVPHPGLLPAGMRDMLPPEAETEARVVSALIGTLAAHGYERVKPPLVEFEETLFAGAGAAMTTATFRMMDPASHRMIGVRADMTPQIARIAATRLGRRPRPLRLSYAGQVLRVKGAQIRPERQIGQVGAELIGPAGPAADIEVIAVAGEALAALGVEWLSVDVTLPTLVPAVIEAHDIPEERAVALRAALDHKDAAAVATIGGSAGAVLGRLLAAAGPAETSLAALDRLELPARARHERRRLGAVLDGLALAAPELVITVDPVENRGFEYHSGISFTFFSGTRVAGVPVGELGRGGRYQAGDPAAPEPATGFTLDTDAILRAVPDRNPPRRVFLPPGTGRVCANELRLAGWITIAALEPAGDWRAEARRLGCSHVYEGGAPAALD